MFKKRKLIIKIIIILSFLGAIGLSAILIYESLKPGSASAQTSNKVGGEIADIIETVGGDRSVEIEPKDLIINNVKDNYYVGDIFNLDIKVSPAEASSKSIIYECDNNEIVEIDSNGEIKCVKEGSAKIKAYIEGYKNISKEIIINVSTVEATNISIEIYDINNQKINLKNGIYELTFGENYFLNANYNPKNTTYKNPQFSIESDLFELNNNSFVANSETNEKIKITAQDGSILTSAYFVVIKDGGEIFLEDFNIIESYQEDFTLSLYEEINIKNIIEFYPSNATDKDLSIEILEGNDLINIKNNKIKAIALGEVQIKIKSNSNQALEKEFSFNIINNEVKDFEALISKNLIVNKKENITINLLSNNDKKPSIYYFNESDYISYEVLDDSILSINSSGVIIPLKEGETTLIVTIDDFGNLISHEYDVLVSYNNLADFNIKLSTNEIHQNANFKISPDKFVDQYNNPASISYLNNNQIKSLISYTYDLEEVAYDGTYFKLLKTGNINIGVDIIDGEEIFHKDIILESIFRPLAKANSSVSSNELFIGTTVQIKNTRLYDENNKRASLNYSTDKKSLIKYVSSDDDILTVDVNGYVLAKAEGSANVQIYFYETLEDLALNNYALVNQIDFNITKESIFKDFSYYINQDLLDNELILFTNIDYNVNELFSLDSLIDKDNNIAYKDGIKYLEFEEDVRDLIINVNDYELENNIINVKNPVQLLFEIYQDNVKKIKTINVKFVDKIEVKLDDYKSRMILDSSTYQGYKYIVPFEYSYYQNEDVLIELNTSNLKAIMLEGSANISLEENRLIVNSNTVGSVYIMLVPMIDENEIMALSSVLKISFGEQLIDSFNTIIYKYQGFKAIKLDNTNDIICYDKIKIECLSEPINSTTNYVIISNSSNALIKNKIVEFKAPGNYQISVIETNSEKMINIDIHVKDFVKLKDKKYSLIQDSELFKFNKENNYYELQRLVSAKLTTLFENRSTHKEVVYESSDENILTIGKSGIITAKKEGKCTITATIYDSDGNVCDSYSLDITIVKTPVIMNITNFLYKIRKLVGHFSAFLVLALMTTCSMMLWLDKKKWLISIPISLSYGFFMAGLTEFLQSLVPNRGPSWADVWLDFRGYLLGFVIMAFIILLSYFIKFKVDQKNHKI